MISETELKNTWKASRRKAPYGGTMICTVPCYRTRGVDEKFYVNVYKSQGEYNVAFPGAQDQCVIW